MTANFSYSKFYKELETSLLTSTLEKRKVWVNTIIEKNISLRELSKLLRGEQKIAIRFLWLISEIGLSDPDKLMKELPFLLDLCEELDPIYTRSFANYWLIAGLPLENEGKAINLLFGWLLSPDTNVTIKSRSLLMLFKLSKKYPELKNEIKLCLIDQKDKHSKEFEKKADKLLKEMEH